MIILLGPDNTGKTTLAQQLVDASPAGPTGIDSIHCNTKTEFDDYYSWLAAPISLSLTVFDRWFFCDIPYAKVVRGEAQSKFVN